MKSHARVVVIGGGIAGCSALYHLTREGWSDVVLVERDELTSGTTWHSAAQVTNFGAVQTMVGLKSHSIRLYKEMAEDPDYPINYHHADGGIRLASSPEHLDGYRHFVSMAKGMGVEFEVIDAEECKRRHPLIETHELLGGMWDPLDGDIDPAQLTQALARRARKAGAEVYRHNPVHDLTQKPNGEWIVHTEKGEIACEMVVNACGYRVNEVGAMMGVEHPVVSMEHQYFLTEPIPELEALDHRVPLLRDPLDDFYSRQEKKGLLVGIYEQNCKTWGLDGIDPDFTNALCVNDLDRCLDNIERVFERMPCLMETGIHTVINGPITYSADGLPLVGKIPGKRNAFCIIGLRAGIGEGGGHGKILAELMVHGEAEWDSWCLDPRRFARYADTDYTALKAIEDYRNEFRFHMPHEHRPAGRPARTTPLYSTLQAAGADFAVVNGWERASFYKPTPDFEEEHTFRFANWHDVVAEEVRAVQERAGIMEVSGFNRYEITGPGARAWLDRLTCSRVPSKTGKVGLSYLLNRARQRAGRGDARQPCRREDLVRLGRGGRGPRLGLAYRTSAGRGCPSQKADGRLFDPGRCRPQVARRAGQGLARHGLVRRARSRGCPARRFTSGMPGPWRCRSVFPANSPGSSMFPIGDLCSAHDVLCKAGEEFGMGRFGLYATESMRLEKGYRHWKADLITEYNPLETGPGAVRQARQAGVHRQGRARGSGFGRPQETLRLARHRQRCRAGPSRRLHDGRRPGCRHGDVGSLWPSRGREPRHGLRRSGPG